ncbi:MAG: hypothetical protein R3F53_02520 [Gammaproteobacteria bacterium]
MIAGRTEPEQYHRHGWRLYPIPEVNRLMHAMAGTEVNPDVKFMVTFIGSGSIRQPRKLFAQIDKGADIMYARPGYRMLLGARYLPSVIGIDTQPQYPGQSPCFGAME